MPVEIERKYLVANDGWRQHSAKGQKLRQGYLSRDPLTIRVRLVRQGADLTGALGLITIKGPTVGITRPEYEYTIPYSDALELLKHCKGPLIEKTRYIVKDPCDPLHEWHVDVFEGDNIGLITAEIELESENDVFLLPTWIGKEVSHDSRYFNSNLSQLR